MWSRDVRGRLVLFLPKICDCIFVFQLCLKTILEVLDGSQVTDVTKVLRVPSEAAF